MFRGKTNPSGGKKQNNEAIAFFTLILKKMLSEKTLSYYNKCPL